MNTNTSAARWLTGSLLVVLGLMASPALGLDLPVTRFDDHLDYFCDSDCSLRDAVYASNESDGADIIRLPAGTFTLSLTGVDEDDCVSGDLDVRDSVIIGHEGPGVAIIDASGLGDRVFDVKPADGVPTINVVLASLTITGGGSTQSNGGGVASADSTLVLNDVTVEANLGGEWGGGLYAVDSDLTLESGCLISGNDGEHGGGVCAITSTVTISDSSIIGNTGRLASGGLHLGGCDLTVLNSTISANRTPELTGGMQLRFTDADIYGSTISFNSSGIAGGGGLYVTGTPNAVNIANSTIYGNTCAYKGGAALVSYTGILKLSGVTIADNIGHGGVVLDVACQLELANTVVVGYCETKAGATVTSWGGNLESPAVTCSLVHPTDHTGVPDPMLSPLGDFGGPTPTVLPLAGSPVVDSSFNDNCWELDQRGFPRDDGNCDCGAVEREDWVSDPLFMDGFESGDSGAWSAPAM